jgi:predicted ester cyclase
MTRALLLEVYRGYLACLNARDWSQLGRFVDDDVQRNGERLGVAGYRALLERDVLEIPDLHFDAELVISEPPCLASRLRFDCTPRGRFLGLEVNGRRVSFAENVFYEFRREKVVRVWSVIDKPAIEAQL